MLKQGTAGQRGWLSPPLLLLGVLASFVACCVAGRLASQQNPFPHFRRFYRQISTESQFYPTSHQVQALGRSRLDRDRIAVLVGGNSILRGSGQVPEKLWTCYLQDELGNGYRVLNLAQNGAYPAEFGGTAAEILARDYPKLIFVTSSLSMGSVFTALRSPKARVAAIPSESFYGYFFWEAYTKGLLPADARRRAAIAAVAATRAGDAGFQEQLRGLSVDALSYSRVLWTALAYSYFCTVWVRPEVSQPPFTQPRRKLPDLDGTKFPPEFLRSAAYADPLVADMRAQIRIGKELDQRARAGAVLRDNEMLFLPAALQGHTLMLVVPYSPYYVARLTHAEQADYRFVQSVLARELRRVGFPTVEAGAGYTPADYADCKHLAESGGKKLAAEVAPAVRRLARQLGYLTGNKDHPPSRGPAAHR